MPTNLKPLSLKQRLDRMTPDEVAAAQGISRVTVYERLKTGKLPEEVWSRIWYSRQRPHGRFSWAHILDTALQVLIEVHGREYVAGYFSTHHHALALEIAAINPSPQLAGARGSSVEATSPQEVAP